MDPVLVRKAREEEMQCEKKHAVYDKVTMSQCLKETGKNAIKTGWADTKKGTSWFAKEYNTVPRTDLFSATSPLEGVKLVEGDGGGPGSRQCGPVRKSLYVTRDAAQNWECEL